MAKTDTGGSRSPRWAFMQGFQVRKNGKPYLDRLRVVQTPWFSVLLHRIHEPDADRDPHTHPWWFASLILSGEYYEIVNDCPEHLPSVVPHRRKRWSLHSMRRDRAHRITRIEGVLWTLVFTGPRYPSWTFWTPEGTVDWRDYLGRGDDSDGTGPNDGDWPG